MKVKILKPFIDIKTGKTIVTDADGCVEMTDERYAEAEKNLQAWGGGYLEPVDDDAEKKAKEDAQKKATAETKKQAAAEKKAKEAEKKE